MKVCSKCKLELGDSCFHKRNRGGLDCYCKLCKKEYAKQYHQSHKEARLAQSKRYYIDNKVIINVKHAQYFQANRGHLLTKNSQRYHTNKEHVQAINSKCFQKHKQRRYLYRSNRMRTDLNFKLSNILRSRLYRPLKGGAKGGSAVRDLGCSIEFLKTYLESKFKPDMTWENWSKTGWHIDHIIPLSSFDLTKRRQFLKACHYTNLQPLWAGENLIKGSKII